MNRTPVLLSVQYPHAEIWGERERGWGGEGEEGREGGWRGEEEELNMLISA